MKPVAQAILKNIERIPEALFSRAFEAMVTDLCSKKSLEVPLLAMTGGFSPNLQEPPKKSNHWMTQRFIDENPGIITEVVAGYLPSKMLGDQATAYVRATEAAWLRHQDKKVDVVIIDDAAYSGAQLVDLVAEALQAAAFSQKTIDHLYIGCVCMTKKSQDKLRSTLPDLLVGLQGVSGAESTPTLHFLGKPILMPTLADLAKQGRMTRAEVREAVRAYGQGRHEGMVPEEVLTLTYLPHKVPDERSTLSSILTDGLVGRIDGRATSTPLDRPFIPVTTPPYRR